MSRFERKTLVTGRDAEDVARKLAPVLREALGVMLKRPEGLGPFLVVEDVRTKKFVQWCGSREKPLRFEAPLLSLVLIGCRETDAGVRQESDPESGTRDPVPDLGAAVRVALETLLFEPLFAVLFEDGALVIESDTFEALVTVERKTSK